MLVEKLSKDTLEARKNKDADRAGLLTTVLSQVKTMAIDDGHRDPTDQDVLKVVRQFLKGVNENLELAAQGKLSAEEKGKCEFEKGILEGYLPKQLTADEIKKIVKASGAKNMGEAMKFLKEKHDGQYDGKMASAAVKEALG